MKNQRFKESLSPLFNYSFDDQAEYKVLLMKASSDEGVMRNFGRNGSKYGPDALISGLKKYNNHFAWNEKEKIIVQEVWPVDSLEDFETRQTHSSGIICELLSKQKFQKVIHLGGGHDHIMPLLIAIDNTPTYENCLIINIDAHCDTRTDTIHHSGTPFRDVDQIGTIPSHLIQFGIHDYANSSSTLEELKRIKEQKIFYHPDETKLLSELNKALENLSIEVSEKTAVVISLDSDGIEGQSLGAVSAVNSIGVSPKLMFQIIELFKSKYQNLFFGIYEFNPVYDTQSHQSKKLISHFIYEFLK